MDGNLRQRILAAVDAQADPIVDFTRQLLRIPTENRPPTGDERRGQEFLRPVLEDLGLETDLFQPDEVPGLFEHPAYHPTGSSPMRHEYADRPNLVGRWRGRGAGRSLILVAHMDVVSPGNLEAWRHDPWGAEMDAEGRIYARGAVDDKGPLAAMVMAVKILKDLGVSLDGDLILESVVDEEFGGGNGTLATILRGYTADGVISGEPSSLAVCPTTFGCVSVSFAMEGVRAHGIEQWKAINPIDGGALLHQAVPRWHARRNERAARDPLLAKRPVPLPLLTRAILAGANIGGASIPPSCEVILWLGIAPGERWPEVEREAEEFAREVAADPLWHLPAAASVNRMGRFLEASQIELDHPLSAAMSQAVAAAAGKPAEFECGASGDLFIYTNYGMMPGLICGPGSLFMAHGADEHITARELVQAVKTYALAICDWCGGKI